MTTPPFTFADSYLVVTVAITILAFIAGHLILHPKMRNGAMLSEQWSRIVGLGIVGIIWTGLEIVRVLDTGAAPMQSVWDWWVIVGAAGVTVVLLWLGLGNPRAEPETQRRERRLAAIEGTPEQIKEMP